MSVKHVFTDNDREYLAWPEHHPNQLTLVLHDNKHRNTYIRSLQTDGFAEHMNPTLLGQRFRIKGREK